MTYKSIDVARYFIMRGDSDEDLLTNMKVQKLLYYAQGYHLAFFNHILFDDEICAWQHGPVVPSVYKELNIYGANQIKLSGAPPKFDVRTTEFLGEIYDVYGVYSAAALRNMTHNESPWKDTPVGTDSIISTRIIKEFFKTQITPNK